MSSTEDASLRLAETKAAADRIAELERSEDELLESVRYWQSRAEAAEKALEARPS